MSMVKRAYFSKDQKDYVRHWNAVAEQDGASEKPIELQFPNEFPIRTPLALRCAIVNAEVVPTLCEFSLTLPL